MPIQILPPLAAPSYFTTASSGPGEDEDEDYSMDDVDSDEDIDMDTLISHARRQQQRQPTRRKLHHVDADMLTTAIVTPGEVVTSDPQWMRGHGTYIPTKNPGGSSNNSEDQGTGGAAPASTIISTLAGTLLKTNKLLSIHPLSSRYTPQIGDLVVGRITDVQTKRWRVDIRSHHLAVLLLSSINLPGGILRRRTAADELQIRGFFQEGDLLVAEVQSLTGGGGSGGEGAVASLHTRSLRFGKLRGGALVAVPPGRIVRSKRHVWKVEAREGAGEIEVIAGVNGLVWVGKPSGTSTGGSAEGGQGVSITRLEEESSESMYSSVNEYIPVPTRREIARVIGCVKAMVREEVDVDESGLRAVYDACVEMEQEEGGGGGGGGAGGGGGGYWIEGERGRKVVERGLRALGRML
ncbi:hypothetical protein BDZ91DRAFT_839690 [Kalaharituber pfeilii]|nr:hypothetical protein BDZ91DRAFT_839690 [Kalaharituber pfeilii]